MTGNTTTGTMTVYMGDDKSRPRFKIASEIGG